MYAIALNAGVLCVIVGWCVFRSIVNCRTKDFSWKREAVQLLFLINLLVIYRITFHPFAKIDGQVQPLIFDSARVWPVWINLVPFVNLLDYPTQGEILLNIIGNSTMFIPTGIMTPLLYKHLASFQKTVFTGFLISLTIEVIQLPFAVRCSDVDDLILNTLGCAAGYGIYWLVCRCKGPARR